MRPATPPRAAAWILGCLLREPDKEALLGDLAEEHELRWRSDSRPNELWWYWRQVVRSVPALLWAAVRRGRWIGVLGAAIAAYALVTLVESAGTVVLSRLFAQQRLAFTVLGLALGLAAMVLGGYVAARIRRGAAGALAVMSALSVIGLMVESVGNMPMWYSGVWLVACPLTALAGGALGRKPA